MKAFVDAAVSACVCSSDADSDAVVDETADTAEPAPLTVIVLVLLCDAACSEKPAADVRESSLDDVAPFDSFASATRTDFCDAGSAGAASGDVDARSRSTSPACTSDATANAL